MDRCINSSEDGRCHYMSSPYYSEACPDSLCVCYEVPRDTDQTIKADAGKPKLTLVPQQIIFDIAQVREYGLAKYGASESWKQVDIQRYRDAAFRHFMAYLRDPEGVDEESGLPHLSHLACNVAFLCELEKEVKKDG